ncbi:MAG: cold-shock protein [Kistimonas sp.]|nr:cold-shock protein [Kistimonas sp.]
MSESTSADNAAGHSRKEKTTGVVKWFNESRGYGFIQQDDGPDVFAHFRSIEGSGYRLLVEGQKVRFYVTQGEKGLQAEEIEVAA